MPQTIFDSIAVVRLRQMHYHMVCVRPRNFFGRVKVPLCIQLVDLKCDSTGDFRLLSILNFHPVFLTSKLQAVRGCCLLYL